MKWRSMIFFCVGPVFAQTPVVNLPPPDSAGWIKLFRGTNTSDFYAYTASGLGPPSKNQVAFPGTPFFIQSGDTIRTTGSPNGQLIFRQAFSHYIATVEMMWPNSLGNTGMMTKIQVDDSGQGGGLPRAIECQGDPNQGMGQVWALGSIGGQSGGTWITVHAKSITHPQNSSQTARQADSTAPEIDYGGVGAPSNNLIVGFPGWQQPRPAGLTSTPRGWITFLVESHGRDTTRHFIDGQKVMQYTNPRIAPKANANQVIKYLIEGMLSLQSEGTVVWYRNFRIKLLPEDPLYASVYGPVNLRNRITPKQDSRKTLLVLSGGRMILVSREGVPVSLIGRRFPSLNIGP